MQNEEFDYLIRRAAQAFIPSAETDIEVGWQQLLAVSGGMNGWLGGECRQQPCCVDLPGPHGYLVSCTPPVPPDINSREDLCT